MSSLFISAILLLLAPGASPAGRLSRAASSCCPLPSLCRLSPCCPLPPSCHPSLSSCRPLPLLCCLLPCCTLPLLWHPLPLSCRVVVPLVAAGVPPVAVVVPRRHAAHRHFVPPFALLPLAVIVSSIALLPLALVVPTVAVVAPPVAVVVPCRRAARRRRCAACRLAAPCHRRATRHLHRCCLSPCCPLPSLRRPFSVLPLVVFVPLVAVLPLADVIPPNGSICCQPPSPTFASRCHDSLVPAVHHLRRSH